MGAAKLAFSDRPLAPRGPKKGQKGPFGATHAKNGIDRLEANGISVVLPLGGWKSRAETARQRSFSQWPLAIFGSFPKRVSARGAPKRARIAFFLQRPNIYMGKGYLGCTQLARCIAPSGSN